MSIQVKQFDEQRAESELKKCPKIVKDYVKILKQISNNWQDIANKAISELRKKPYHEKRG